MYIREIHVKNIHNVGNFAWELRDSEQLAGWHVLIGDNGSGKSSVLRSVALALVGERDASGLRQDWSEWLTKDHPRGEIALALVDENRSSDEVSVANLTIERDAATGTIDLKTTSRHTWSGSGRQAGFSASYGPFRRFTGGNAEYSRLFRANPRLAAHLSVFGEDIALTEAIEWLKELHYKQLEQRPEGDLLEQIRQFINQPDFLPHNVRFESISSAGVKFVDAGGNSVNVDNLSDGYRSVLSMTFEIIRQLQLVYSNEPIFSRTATDVVLPGVVMIDEVDAHLHPSWQREIGRWFIRHFPKMQFIVTTHSPLVCQAATHGSIWRLPIPGRGLQSYRVDPLSPQTAEEWKRLVYGNILEAYSTELFGEDIQRSPEAQAKYERVSELTARELDRPLSPDEEAELNRLTNELPTTPYKRVFGE